MIWNVFFVVFAILVLAAIVLTVWFLKLGKRIFLLIPLLLLAGGVRVLCRLLHGRQQLSACPGDDRLQLSVHGGQRLGRGKPAKGGRQLHPHR